MYSIFFIFQGFLRLEPAAVFRDCCVTGEDGYFAGEFGSAHLGSAYTCDFTSACNGRDADLGRAEVLAADEEFAVFDIWVTHDAECCTGLIAHGHLGVGEVGCCRAEVLVKGDLRVCAFLDREAWGAFYLHEKAPCVDGTGSHVVPERCEVHLDAVGEFGAGLYVVIDVVDRCVEHAEELFVREGLAEFAGV